MTSQGVHALQAAEQTTLSVAPATRFVPIRVDTPRPTEALLLDGNGRREAEPDAAQNWAGLASMRTALASCQVSAHAGGGNKQPVEQRR